MGRMKELYTLVMDANNGIPEELTLAELLHMRELELYNYKQYQRSQNISEKEKLKTNRLKDKIKNEGNIK